MAIFPRRQTDQVYEMLQQVQRKMTAHNEGSSWQQAPSAGSTGLPSKEATPYWRRQATVPIEQPAPAVDKTAPAAVPVPAPAAPLPLAPPPPLALPTAPNAPVVEGPVLRLSVALASVLVVLWLLTVVIAFLSGRYLLSVQAAPPPAGLAAGPAGHREVIPAIPREVEADREPVRTGQLPFQGDDVLVLKSVKSFDNAIVAAWTAEADKYNAIGKQKPRELPPYFGLRRPKSGGLQLVYGLVNGEYGLDRGQFESQAAALRSTAFKDATWISLR